MIILLGDSLPIMGQIPFIQNAYVSAGHNCWGILWSCISGLAMSELINERTCKVVDLSPFNPMRFVSKKLSRGRKVGDIDIGEQW
jgi:glycine/D-amino acid oxidase-like deaminating enzyme